MVDRSSKRFAIALVVAIIIVSSFVRSAWAGDKPNILVIMADDIGYWNISAYNRGMMGTARPTSIA